MNRYGAHSRGGVWLALAMLLWLVGCAEAPSDPLPPDSAEIRVTVGADTGRAKGARSAPAAFPPEVDRIVVSASGPNVRPVSATIPRTGGSASLVVPAGVQRQVTARAMAGSVVRMQGQTTIAQLVAGDRLSIRLTLVDQATLNIAAPAAIAVGAATATRLTPLITAHLDTSVVFSVNGIVGGNGTVGTITNTGDYTPPAVIPTPATVTVRATSNEDPTLFSEVTIQLTPRVVDNTAPTVTINAGGGALLNPGGSVNLVWQSDEAGNYAVRLGGTGPTTGTALASGIVAANAPITTPVAASALADGNNTIHLYVTDQAGNTGTVSTGLRRNRVPVAVADSATTAVNTATVIAVLGNDSDGDGDPLSITAVTQGTSGTTAITTGAGVPDRITYTPNNGFTGADSFNYTIGDGNGATASATVTVTVAAANVDSDGDGFTDQEETRFFGTNPNDPASKPFTAGLVHASAGFGNTRPNNASSTPALSADGRYLAFVSNATNLVAGGSASGGIFRRDNATGTVIQVTPPLVGGITPSISDDGQRIAFATRSDLLAGGDTNNQTDVYVIDLPSGTATLISGNAAGVPGRFGGTNPQISGDGRYVVFRSASDDLLPTGVDTNNRSDIFVKTVQTGAITRVSVSSAGVQGNFNSTLPGINRDGRFIFFSSSANQLVTGDTNNRQDVFRHDRDPDGNGIFDEGNGVTIRVSVGSGGTEANGTSSSGAITADGQRLVFSTIATNLPGGIPGLYLRDIAAGTTTRIDIPGSAGVSLNGLSADGRYLIVSSSDSSLVIADLNRGQDAFVKDLQTGAITLVSAAGPGTPTLGVDLDAPSIDTPVISDDGRYLAFGSSAVNLSTTSSPLNGVYLAFNHTDSDGDRLVDHAEFLAGTDPARRDTDGDGAYDGAETAWGLNPLDPASTAPTISPAFFSDLEGVDSGGLTGTGSWAHGTPTFGPAAANSGTQLWGTNLTGIHPGNTVDFLTFAERTVSGPAAPVFDFRYFIETEGFETNYAYLDVALDGVSFNYWQPQMRTGTGQRYPDCCDQADLQSVWENQNPTFGTALFDLSGKRFEGQIVQFRIRLEATGTNTTDAGMYIDDIYMGDNVDLDGDGLDFFAENRANTDPHKADTDGDGLSDGAEINGGTDPNLADTDGDGLSDRVETNTGVFIGPGDTGTDPNNPDGDGDGLLDGAEVTLGTSPLLSDTDGDGASDLAELLAGTDPTVTASAPVAPRFTAPVEFPAGTQPGAMVTGDFKRDGKRDLAVVNRFSSTVSVLTGDGLGGLSAPVGFTTGSSPAGITVGRFDGGTSDDLAVANRGGRSVSILLGDDLGGFGAKTDFPAGSSPTDLAAADLTGDGITDLLVSNRTFSGTVSLLAGNGDGTFGAPQSTTVGRFPEAIAIGNLDSGTGLDAAVSNTSDTTVSILLNNGTGTLTVAATPVVGLQPGPLVMRDLNGDGNTDLAVGIGSGIALLFGDGLGGFGPAVQVNAGFRASDLSAGDFDGDGNTDLATLTDQDRIVALFTGDGTGNFTLRENHAAGDQPAAIVAAPMDGDALDDLMLTSGNRGSVAMLLADGAGGLTGTPVYNRGTNRNRSLAIGDIDGDTTPDLVTGDGTVLLGDGLGGFTPGTDILGSTGAPISTSTPVLAELTGDGNLDLAFGNRTDIELRPGDGLGNFPAIGASLTPLGDFANTLRSADLNGDGNGDLVAVSFTGTTSLMLGNGTGGFTVTTITMGTRPVTVVVADLNGDTVPDLLAPDNRTNTIQVRLGDGTGGFGPEQSSPIGREAPQSVTLVDLNRDGTPDLVIPAQSYAVLMLGDGTGGFTRIGTWKMPNVNFGIRGATTLAAIKNGNPAAAVLNISSTTVTVMAESYPVANGSFGLESADLDGDGFSDLIIPGDRGVTVLIQR